MTAGEILDLVGQRTFGDTKYTREEALKWMSTGTAEFMAMTQFGYDKGTLTTTAGTQEYPIPFPIMDVKRAIIQGYPPMTFIGIMAEGQVEGLVFPWWSTPSSGSSAAAQVQGAPTFMYVRRDTTTKQFLLGFFPVPDTSYTINMLFTALPSRIHDTTQVPVIPIEYHRALYEFIMMNMLPRDQSRIQAAQFHERRWESIISAAIPRLNYSSRREVNFNAY